MTETTQSPPPSSGPSGGRPLAKRGIKPLLSWKAHKACIVSVFLVVATGGLGVAWVKGRPTYYTEAALRISPKFVRNLRDDEELRFHSEGQYVQFVKQQMATITRFDVVSAALDRLGSDRYLWQAETESDRRAAERLAGALQVQHVRDTYLVVVGLSDDEPRGLAEIVGAVVDAYMETQKREEIFGNDVRIVNLARRREELEELVTERLEKHLELSRELGMTVFENQFKNPWEAALDEAKAALAKARLERISSAATLEALEKSHATIRAIPLDPEVEELVAQDKEVSRLVGESHLFAQEVQERTRDLTDEHPRRRRALDELRIRDAELATVRDRTAARIRAHLVLRRETRMRTARAEAEAELRRCRDVERQLTDRVQVLHERVTWFAEQYDIARTNQEEIQRYRQQIAVIDDRVDHLSLEASAPGFVWISSPPRVPQIPIRGGRKKLFAVFLVMALGLALAAPILLDLLDRRIHAANDLESILGFPPLGWVVESSDERTREYASDQFRRIAHALQRERRQRGTSSFVLTAVRPSSGSTSLALQIARELAAIGSPAVTVEANAFRPDPRYGPEASGESLPFRPATGAPPRTGGPEEPRSARVPPLDAWPGGSEGALGGPTAPTGLSGLLSGDAGVSEVVVPATTDLPDRVPIGPTDDRRLERAERLEAAIARLSEEYEIVILDAPPLLLSADAELVIGAAGGTVLVVEAESVQPGIVVRAARMLEKLHPPLVASLLNRVEVYRGAGYLGEVLAEHSTGRRAEDAARSRGFWPFRHSRPEKRVNETRTFAESTG